MVRILLLLLLAARASCFFTAVVSSRGRCPTKLLAEHEALSELVTSIAPSKTIEIHALTMQLKEAGEKVISLSVGEPDFDPPEAVVEATATAAKEGLTRYTEVTGTQELRSKVAEYLKKKNTPFEASEIVVTNGAKQAVYEAVLALCGPGDEVIVPKPYWVSYPEIVKMAGATPVFVETLLEDGYKLQPHQISSVLSEKTKMLVLCNPCNPTGACLDENELKALNDVLPKNVWVLADEIYERLHYGESEKHVSFAAIDDHKRTVIVNGFSKAYGMTGYRLGYLAAPGAVAKAAAKIQGQITSCASSVSQAAGVAALMLADDALDSEVAEFKRRRDFVLTRLGDIATKTHRIKPPPDPPGGAFYVLPEIDACFGLEAWKRDESTTPITDSTSFCAALLANRKLALVPGDAFGAPKAIRISYAASQETLAMAMDALEKFLYEDVFLDEPDEDDPSGAPAGSDYPTFGAP